MEPPPPAAKFRAPAPKKVKENEDGGGEGVAAQPLADSTPNSQGEGKKSEPTAAAEGASSLPPPPPKKSGKHGAGAAKGGSYKPPSWGLADPPEASGLSLTVLKGGIEVSSISLDNRTHILLGRQQGVVDVLLEHPSISRKHAILQHGQNGALFLFDNGSTHGCIVNKNKIPSKEFHRLHVGDVIKFGESTRLYALEGPEELRPAEYESENLRNLRLDAGRKQLAAKLAKLKAGAAGEGKGAGDSGEYGISWGFDEDAVAEEEDEDGDGMEGDEGEVELPDYLKTEAQKRRRRDTKVGLTEDSVHKRDAKLFEKLQQKLTKVEHLLTENERITAKEGGQGGLTEGQQAQLARNDKAITGIRLQIEEIEETIRSKNKARERGKELEEGGAGGEKGGGGKGGKGAAEDSEENDDYYDRTAPVLSASRASGSDPASKKAEIRVRRFGARDKTKKLSAAVPGVGVGGGSGDGELGADGGAGAGGGAPVAQTLEALTRRREVVAEDLERTQAGLAELEAEEAEEAGEAALAAAGGGGDEEVAADPLDKFMSENRQKERRQALSRLTAQREALREEEARLKVMIEAARPSMPSLKTAAPASAAASTAAAEEDKKEAPPAKDNPDTAAKADRPEAVTGKKKPPPPALPDQSPTPIAAPARPRRPTDAGPRIGEAEVQGQGLGRGVEGAGSEEGAAAEPEPEPARSETKPASGPRKRGTPVGASMLPPPPAKRPQRKEKTSTPATERVGGGDGSPPLNEAKPKRTVKGPSAMPPPPGKPSAGTAGVGTPAAKAGNGGRGATGAGGKTLGKEVLEGGDVDWVPPKDALEKMAALNKKFGY